MYRAKEKVLEYAGFLCGIIRDKEDSMMGELKYVNDYTLMALREDRMVRMLICDSIAYGRLWNDYGFAKRFEMESLGLAIEDELLEDLVNDFLLKTV